VASVGELPDLALLAPEAPEELVRVVRRGLSAEPHQRGSAAAFALDLRHACRPEPVRLPVAGVPDVELGRTGMGPRTELTHQVPGNRPRGAHAAPARGGRRTRLQAVVAARLGEDGLRVVIGGALRRGAVVGGVLVAVAAGLTGAAWAGASWGGAPEDPVPAAEATPAPAEPATPAGPVTPTAGSGSGGGGAAGSTAPSAAPTAPSADDTAAPADPAGWTAVVAELYARRADAFTAADTAALSGVYPAGSDLLDRDTAAVQALIGSGQALAGFAPQVRRLESVTPETDGRVLLRLVDELPDYRVVAADRTEPGGVQEVPGRGEAQVRLELQRTADGWRISDARIEP
jgi:hypothetical protein